MRKICLAIDIGAYSGRHIAGWMREGVLEAEEVYRFPNGMKESGGHLFWDATARKMETARLVVWAQHGICGAGKDLDETFGLIETAEKGAEIYMKIAHLPIRQTITDDGLRQIEKHFRVTAREGYLG